MDYLNKAIIIGTLGADPELKFTNGGAAVLRLRVATNETWMDNGQRRERTEWHAVSFFNKRAESLSRLLSKGSKVFVEGRIQTRSWEDRDGNKRYATEINAFDVGLLGDSQRQQQQPARAPEPAQHQESTPFDGGVDDIPF